MIKAICLPYSVDQNEPSRPINRIIDLPYHDMLREQFLKNLFIKHVCAYFECDEITIRTGGENDYGDLIVEGPGGLFLFDTYISE